MSSKRIVSILAFVFVAAVLLVPIIRKNAVLPKPAFSEIYSMNTVIDIEVYGKNKEKVLDKIVQKINEINKLTDDFSKASDVYKINLNAGIKPVKVNPVTFDMIAKSVSIAEQTNGAFDISIYPVSKIWGFKNGNYRIPTETEIQKALKLVSYKDIVLDSENHTVFLKKNGEAIDLGGIAKGYTLDLVKKILDSSNTPSALVNMGGNVLTYKKPPEGKFWSIGIKNPRGDGIIGILKIKGTEFISTSGDYERYFIKNGIRYCHIMSPFTGKPARKIISDTVISEKGYLGDALSTAFFVSGKEYALNNAKRFGVSVVGFDNNLKPFYTPELKNILELEK